MSSPLLSGLSQVVATISPPSGGADNTPVEVTNLKALGSYNWINYRVPTIVIPGRPTVWKDLPLPIHLNESHGAPFFDESIAKKCGSTLESLLRAIGVCQETDPDFDLSKEGIDIVTNRRNLRGLMSFANSGRGNRGGSRNDDFRIDAQLAVNGQTMVLTAYEKPSQGQQHRSNFIGYDHILERMCTEEHPIISAADSRGRRIPLRPIGYHRIVRYDLLGLRLLVRSRVDGMLDESTSEPEIDELSRALEGTRLESEPTNTSPTPLRLEGEGSGLQHIKFGEHVPQTRLMDIKLAPKGNVYWSNVYPQYFLSQTPTLRVATRDQNYVTRMQTHDQASLQSKHDDQSQRFRNLISVLKKMRETLQTHGSSSQPLAFVWNQRGDVMVYRIREKGEYLSDEGLDKF